MSFRFGQFGTGFLKTRPPATTLRFRDLMKRRGRDVSIVELTETGSDAYGQPVYSESSYTEKAFLERSGRERDLPPGTVKENFIELFMVPWAAIGEEGYEVEVDEVRYHVTALDDSEAYLMVEAERKV